jgi:hypothetical protein
MFTFCSSCTSFGKCINLRQRENFFELLWTLNIGGPRHSPSAPMPNRANSNYYSRHLTRLVFKSRSFFIKITDSRITPRSKVFWYLIVELWHNMHVIRLHHTPFAYRSRCGIFLVFYHVIYRGSFHLVCQSSLSTCVYETTWRCIPEGQLIFILAAVRI